MDIKILPLDYFVPVWQIERNIYIDRWIDREIDVNLLNTLSQFGRQIERKKERKIDRQIDRQRDRYIDRGMLPLKILCPSLVYMQIERKIDRYIDRQIDVTFLNTLSQFGLPAIVRVFKPVI